jgi:hypothetical protein
MGPFAKRKLHEILRDSAELFKESTLSSNASDVALKYHGGDRSNFSYDFHLRTTKRLMKDTVVYSNLVKAHDTLFKSFAAIPLTHNMFARHLKIAENDGMKGDCPAPTSTRSNKKSHP